MINRLILLSTVLLLAACSKQETYELIHSEEVELLNNPILKDIYHRNFKEDFITKNPDEVANEGVKKHYQLIKSASFKDPNILAENYSFAKESINDLVLTASPGEYHIIQSVAARFLRNHFLVQETMDVQEIRFLTKMLVDFKSIDLDVLVDGYIAISDSLNEDENEFYLGYIDELHKNLSESLKNDFDRVRKKYDLVKGQKSAVGVVLEGRMLERTYKSCVYSSEILGL